MGGAYSSEGCVAGLAGVNPPFVHVGTVAIFNVVVKVSATFADVPAVLAGWWMHLGYVSS